MTVKFYQIGHNSFSSSKIPWVQEITSGVINIGKCPVCGRGMIKLEDVIHVRLERNNRASIWPDAMGCGDVGVSLIISQKFLELWKKENMGKIVVGEIVIEGYIPPKLRELERGRYFWLKGEEMKGADIDFEKSGFVDARFCQGCGSFEYNISKTYDKQHSGIWPYEIIKDTWNGENLFTTNMTPWMFFCTDKVFDFASRHYLTNFEFIPVETASTLKAVPYLKKRKK